jgi:hypothetical protein
VSREGAAVLPVRTWALLYGAALAACFAIYAPSLEAPFLSDDFIYLGNRPVREPSVAHLYEILEPRSDLTLMVANYAPVHLLVHTAQWQLFGERFLGYHAMNLALHAANSLLLAALFLRAGLGRVPALLGAAFFLVHPANVEAVAWISQMKTQVSMVFTLVALALFERRVALGSAAFVLSLGAKATSAVALPVAAAWEWIRGERPSQRQARASLAVWTALFTAFAVVQLVAFRHAHQGVEPLSESRAVQLFTTAAIGARYLWMAATSLGVSTYHEPAASESPLDPLVLAALAAGLALGARTFWALRQRREEGAWWLWAAVSYAPVAQVFPFLYPMADRYLYFILPGLIGGAALLGADVGGRIPPAWRTRAGRAGLALACAVLALFAARSHERARLWISEARIFADGVRHYPDGAGAAWVHARQAAAAGDVARAVELARRATRRGHRDFEDFERAPEFAALRGRPEVEAFLRERARRRVDRVERRERLHVSERLGLARALLFLGEPGRAAEVLRVGAAQRGAWAAEIEALLREAERQLARRPAAAEAR